MIRDYRFKDIEKYLRKDSDIGQDILNAFDTLSDAAIIFSPIIFGAQFLPILELLDVKDKLLNLGHKVYDYIAKKTELNYIDRTEQIKAAYALICYTAYFDVLQEGLPSKVRKKLKFKLGEKKKLVEASTGDSETLQIPSTVSDVYCRVFLADHITSIHDIKEQLENIYDRITQGLIKTISETSIFDMSNENEENEFLLLKKRLNALPAQAIKVYEAQYLSLADQFNDFALFAQLQNFNGIYHSLEQNKKAIDLLRNTTEEIDIGLNKLNSVVNSIVTNFSLIQGQDIVDDLKKKYTAAIEEPIIDSKEIQSDTDTINLRFPKIVDAFIPQSYKCLSYQHKETHLENEDIWKKLPAKRDLERFFIKYLYSPDSIEYPLLILGHPGSGKSLLTKVLSAQLMSNTYTVIRIPLREVNAESGIDVLVEDQIKKLTNRPLSQGYGGFAAQFAEKPLIIILDGYDELLQARGTVFSGYLERVRTFQQDQKAMKRPVRIIITSRITLIDKARVPLNSTILRLLEFNSQQRQTWINIWNNINAEYFTNSSIKPFNLPKVKNKKNSVIELAEQPLLLLMLALYDSESNELATTSNIKRTELYDNLLRRFVRRERSRYVPNFTDKSLKEQETIIDQEMNRLGVAAIGMYNRQEVVILSKQLEADLNLFEAHRTDGSPKSNTLRESDSVLGGFFFIHKSTALDIDAHSEESESAYEFLHNTFGEFLAADFILRNTINEVKDIYVDRKFKTAGLANKLSNPDAFNSNWFYCLMFVPLYSRPVVIEMLREHLQKALQRALQLDENSINITFDEFVENLNFIVQNQLNMILNKRNSPRVMRNGILFDRDIPLLGYLSTYSLNLIIIASAFNSNGFEFCENEYHNVEIREAASRPWDKLTTLWKAWFSSSDLAGLSVILKAKRVDIAKVQIMCNEKFEATHYEQPIDILLCISSTIADNLLTGLSGLHTGRFSEIARMEQKDIYTLLEGENPNLYYSYLITQLNREINGFSYKDPAKMAGIQYHTINKIIQTLIMHDRIHKINRDTLLNFLTILECCIQRKMIFSTTRRTLIESLPRLIESRINLKKDVEQPEVIAVTHLIKLLSDGIIPLEFNNHTIYNEPFYRDILFDLGWSENIDRIAYFQSRSVKNYRLFPQTFMENEGNQVFFIKAFENMILTQTEDSNKFERKFFAKENILILTQTNPELLSQVLLTMLRKRSSVQLVELDSIVDFFLKKCIDQLSSVGIYYFGVNATTNAISIAQLVGETSALMEIGHILQKQLFSKHPAAFSYMMYLYPSLVSKLITTFPDTILEELLFAIDRIPMEKSILSSSLEKLLDYIEMLRRIYEFIDRKEIPSRRRNILHQLVRLVHESVQQEAFNFDRLNVNQLGNLAWFASLVGDKQLLARINDFLHFNMEFSF